MSDSPSPGVDGGNALIQKNGRGENIHYHWLGYSFERHSGSGGSYALLNGQDEVLNFREMFLFGRTVQVYDYSGNLLAWLFKLTVSVNMCD